MPELSDTKIKAAIRRAMATGDGHKIYDQKGLYLILEPREKKACGAWWRQRYTWGGKEQTLSCGTYPNVGLAAARERGEVIRKQAANDINPSGQRKQQKLAKLSSGERTYKAVAAEWLKQTAKARAWTAEHSERIARRIEVHFTPWLGSKDVATIAEEDILSCLRRMEDADLIDTARRALSEADLIFRFAKKRGYLKVNPVADLKNPDTLPAVKVRHHAALVDPQQVGALMRAIDAYHGGLVVRSALQFLPLVFVRPGELRLARWSEFDLEAEQPQWRIPAERMKMREQHIVPLSRQAVAILQELSPVTGPEGLVFPQVRNASRPLSENTINVALRGCGYAKDQQTGHGFRTTASTLLNELEFRKDAIERQLAHGERDKSRASYNAAQYLPERRKMMQSWADYLDKLKAANVVQLRQAG
jgi:integrase